MPDARADKPGGDFEDRIRWLQATYASQRADIEEKTAEEEKQLAHQEDVKVDDDAKSMEKELLRKEELRNNELEQRIKNQQKFFKFALVVIGVPVLVASVGFGVLVCRDKAGDVAYAAFFASVVAEVIGLSYILGNYFFPNQKNDSDHRPDGE